MVIYILIRTINVLTNLIILLIVVDAVLTLFLNPFHPLRATLDRIVVPLLGPIRRIVPPLGMIDFSPLILILLIEGLSFALTNLLYSLR